MDRNAEFRRRLNKRLNPPPKKGHFVGRQGFDPTPYVDILMEKTYFEDMDSMEEFMEDVLTDPDYDFIFGHSSLLNPDQKTKTAEGLMHRVVSYHEFDPEPYSKMLIDLYGTPAFAQYLEIDEDGEEDFDFSPYFAKYDFTKEQKELISKAFFEHRTTEMQAEIEQKERSIVKKERIGGSAILIVCVIVPSLFIPNLLQRMGWLPQDTGWFLKITIGIISCIVLLAILLKVTAASTKDELRRRNNH